MIGRIASYLGALGDGVKSTDVESTNGGAAVLAVEGGTGTGKTAAYLLSALPMAQAAGKKIVIATGTVALQGQLVNRDIPDVLAATGWDFRYALAKGRRRYLCPLRLQQCQDTISADRAGLFLYEDEITFNPDAEAAMTLTRMSAALRDGSWDGDRDNWPETVPHETWQALTVDRNQCSGYRCRLYAECCFFQAREAMGEADCIVANHDLVLADLMLGGGAILPEPEQCIYIFDEAHKLGVTALNHFASLCRLNATSQWLEQLDKTLQIMVRPLDGISGIKHHIEECRDMVVLAQPLVRQSYPLFDALLVGSDRAGVIRYRFPEGHIDDQLRVVCEQLAALFSRMQSRIENLHKTLEGALEDTQCPVPRVDIEQYFQAAGQWLGRVGSVTDLWFAMASPDTAQPPTARWLTLEDNGDIRVSVSPIIAGPRLQTLLWQRCYAAIATSATLRSLGSFARFCRDVGLDDTVDCLAVPAAFDYAAAGVLAIPDIGADGSQPERHTEALIKYLPGLLEVADSAPGVPAAQGSLVLFASRRQMGEVAGAIAQSLPGQLLIQGELSVAEMVKRHQFAVDEGRNSVIFGLASFAEGMDLPGRYCTHVVIAKLPFAVPDDPLQEALTEWIEATGGNAFRELTLPDASLRLIQACGRLLRNESDTGRVTILDSRLLHKSYGRQLLDALPPFRRQFG